MTNSQLLNLILCLSYLTISANLFSQNYVGVAPWDNALSYNPSIVGAYTDQSIQMNILTRKISPSALPAGTIIVAPRPGEFIGFAEGLVSPKDINQSYFLAYQKTCLLYTSPSPRDRTRSRMPSSA